VEKTGNRARLTLEGVPILYDSSSKIILSTYSVDYR
jgi:hypothetical protein